VVIVRGPGLAPYYSGAAFATSAHSRRRLLAKQEAARIEAHGGSTRPTLDDPTSALRRREPRTLDCVPIDATGSSHPLRFARRASSPTSCACWLSSSPHGRAGDPHPSLENLRYATTPSGWTAVSKRWDPTAGAGRAWSSEPPSESARLGPDNPTKSRGPHERRRARCGAAGDRRPRSNARGSQVDSEPKTPQPELAEPSRLRRTG